MIQNAMLLALLIIFTFLKIPMGVISFTMQLFIVFIIALVASFWDSIMIIGVYMFLGLIGIPIFSAGGGLGYIYQPSFGFMIGFLFLCPCVQFVNKLLKKLKFNDYASNIIATLMGLLVDYLFGAVYAYLIFNVHLHSGYDFIKVLSLVIAPFIMMDVFKCILASIIGQKLKNVLNILDAKHHK